MVRGMTPDRPTIWAYTYKLSPPLPASQLRELKALIAKEHAAAQERAGKWEARLVADERVAHILVVSDSPNLDRAANQRIEDELHRLEATFSLTVPLAVDAGGPDIPPKE